jgi:hypothetical protein
VIKKGILVTATALFASIAVLPSPVFGDKENERDKDRDRNNPVCYLWDIFPDERFKLNVSRHSPLSERAEERAFGHPRQTAFSVHGKHVLFDTMATVEGTVVTATRASATAGPTGAHMGLHSKFVRGDGSFDFARPITVECTADEVSATPAVWNCQSRNDFDTYHGFSQLIRIDEAADPVCGVFEDGQFGGFRATAQPIRGPASVLKGK